MIKLKHNRCLTYLRDVGVRVEFDGLVAGVVARHVAFAAVNAHLRINESHHVLPF